MSAAANGERIVEVLTQRGPQTRAELAEAVARDRTTVGTAIDWINEQNPAVDGETAIYAEQLLAAQLPPHVVKAHEDRPGKNPEVMVLGRPAGRVVGVEIGHGHLSVGVGDANGRLLGSPEYLESPHEISKGRPERTFERIAAMVRRQLASSDADPKEVRAVALSVPTPVGSDGKTLSKHLLPGFDGIDINARMRKKLVRTASIRTTVDIWVENDADVLARGEHRHGKAFGIRDFAVLKCSSGIGAAVVTDGRLLRGRDGGGAGEIGHCPIRPDLLSEGTRAWNEAEEPLCRCTGVGHFEAYAGGEAITRRIGELDPALRKKDLDSAIESALKNPEGKERLVIDEAAALIGIGVNGLINLFNPQMVLICGKLSEMGEELRGAIVDECRSQSRIFGDPDEVVLLGSGADEEARRRIGVRGAVTTALRKSPPPFRYTLKAP